MAYHALPQSSAGYTPGVTALVLDFNPEEGSVLGVAPPLRNNDKNHHDNNGPNEAEAAAPQTPESPHSPADDDSTTKCPPICTVHMDGVEAGRPALPRQCQDEKT